MYGCSNCFLNQRMKCVVCLKGMKDEDLTQWTRIIPFPKWSTVLFPNGISVLQDGKYTHLFLKRGPFSHNNICFVFFFFFLWQSSLRPRCSKKVAFLHGSILHWCPEECNGNQRPSLPPGSTVLPLAPGSLMTPRPGPQLTLKLTTRPISTGSLEGLPICTSDHNATKSSWCLTLIQHVTSESPRVPRGLYQHVDMV